MGRPGGIDRHLAETYASVAKWLEYENPTSIGGGQDADLFALALEPEEKPDQPEVLKMLRQSRLFNIPVFNGSVQDWPYIATLELQTCIEAEDDQQLQLATNIRLQAKNRQAIGNED